MATRASKIAVVRARRRNTGFGASEGLEGLRGLFKAL